MTDTSEKISVAITDNLSGQAKDVPGSKTDATENKTADDKGSTPEKVAAPTSDKKEKEEQPKLFEKLFGNDAPDNFVHLHVHTEYSLLDGAAPLKRLVDTAAKMGMPALAMTDHGNMYATIKFVDLCTKAGIRPIVGCEFYVVDDMHSHEAKNSDDSRYYHLVLLAKDYEGYKNLSKLNSYAWLEGYYYKPRIDLDLLEKYSDGLICLTACIAGAVPKKILQGKYEEAKAYAVRMKNMFADGDFYVELQNHGLEDEIKVLPELKRLAAEIGAKCVATNDSHYILREDAEMHDIVLCIGTASYQDDVNRMKWLPNDSFYLKSRAEMAELFEDEYLDTSYEIAAKCDFKFPPKHYQVPDYLCPDGLKPAEYLRKLTYEGLVRRYGKITDELKERAETELDVIISMGFPDYYLIVWDFIFWAKNHDIPIGKGRGSGVGSLVAYAIGITDVEPLKYDLIFERFLNKDRTSMPDFDIDICYNRRGEVIQYVKEKYGEHRISQIITFGKMKKKQAIKDVARVFRLPFQDVTKMTKGIGNFGEDDKKVHIPDLIDPNGKYLVNDLYELYNADPSVKKVIDIAAKIEGMPRNTSIHAAGVVIYRNPAIDTIPLAKNGDEITTQFDMIEVEGLGLLKMDFLALMTLTDVKMAHDYVLKATGRNVDFAELGYEDPAVYELISTGQTDAVFQLEGEGMKKFLTRLKPVCMEDVIAGISLYRPGPLKDIDKFLYNRKHADSIAYKTEALRDILQVTSGIIVYQEQAMMITRKLAGYTMTDADNFRSIISKKKIDKIPVEREKFIHGKVAKDGTILIPGCVRNGIPEDVALNIFQEMESFASYAFNKSHAAAYAYLCYETAFYKRYYPTEFMAAVLNNRINKPDDTKKYMAVLKLMNIALLPPDINKSESYFTPEKAGIRYGLGCIKNVGITLTDEIVRLRNEDGPFSDLYDFIKRLGAKQQVNKRVIESLIYGGALDSFNMTRATLLANYERILQEIDAERKIRQQRESTGQMDMFSLFGSDEESAFKPKPFEYEYLKELPNREKLLKEKEMTGMYLTGHIFDGYEKEFEAFNFNTSMIPDSSEEDDEESDIESAEEIDNALTEPKISDGMDVKTGGIITKINLKRTKDGKEMAIFSLEDMYDNIECIMLARALMLGKKYLEQDSLVRIRGRLAYRDGECKIYVSELTPWDLKEKEVEAAAKKEARVLYFNLTDSDVADKDKLDRINAVLYAHPGSNTVRFQHARKLHLHSAKVGNLEAVAHELIGILGPENVKIR